MSTRTTSTLIEVNPMLIKTNPDNPRKLFDQKDLVYLQQSIQEVGVLVPLIVYKDIRYGNQYVLLDGERRLRCAKQLKLNKVRVNEIEAPSRLQNILLMFNIHNVRKDWELVPTALKLETILRLLPDESSRSHTHVAKITGMSSIRVAECRRILKFDKKYIDLAITLDPKIRIPGDFFSQLELALEKLSLFPEITSKHSKNEIIDIMIEKYREKTIINFINEFRMLKKIFMSGKKGVDRDIIISSFNNFLVSKQEIDPKSKKITKAAMSMEDLFEDTSFTVYNEDGVVKKTKELARLLNKLSISESKKINQVVSSLEDLSSTIKVILDRAKKI